MKRGRLWVAGLVVLALGAVVVVVTGGWPPRVPWFGGSCDLPQSVTALGSSSAPRSGGIRVVDQGFTQPSDEFKSVSLAAILENTSDRIAYGTRVTVELLDERNSRVTGFEAADDEIPILMPGQRIGVGMTVSPTIPDAASRTVAAFQVDTDTTRWLADDALGEDFAPVTAEYLNTVRRDPEVPHSNEIHFTVTSETCRPLEGWNPAAVFRDSGGDIVGGMRRYSAVTEACAQNDRETWVIPLKATPPTADDANTEIYPYCDIQ